MSWSTHFHNVAWAVDVGIVLLMYALELDTSWSVVFCSWPVMAFCYGLCWKHVSLIKGSKYICGCKDIQQLYSFRELAEGLYLGSLTSWATGVWLGQPRDLEGWLGQPHNFEGWLGQPADLEGWLDQPHDLEGKAKQPLNLQSGRQMRGVIIFGDKMFLYVCLD